MKSLQILILLAASVVEGRDAMPPGAANFRSTACGVEFHYPGFSDVKIEVVKLGECAIFIKRKGEEPKDHSQDYVPTEPEGVTIHVAPGSIASEFKKDSCMELRKGVWWQTCGKGGYSAASPVKTSTLRGIKYGMSSGTYLRSGEGGYQGLISWTEFVLEDEARVVSIAVAECDEGCELIIHSLRLFEPSSPEGGASKRQP